MDRNLRDAWLALVAFAFALAYLAYPSLPGNDPQFPLGWWGWWDQSQYLKSATAISKWALGKDSWWYPLGYPALGAIFARITPTHAFFAADLLLVLASAGLLFSIARRYVPAREALVVGIAFIAFHRWLLVASQVVPWNTLPIQAAIYFSIYALLTFAPARAALAIALTVAFCVWVRPLDTLVMAPLLAAGVWLAGGWKRRFAVGAACAAIIAASWLAEAALKMHVFGSIFTPYDQTALSVGFGAWPTAAKLYWLLVDGRDFFQVPQVGLLFSYPWLVLAPAALGFVARREGLRGAAIAAAVATGFMTYVEFNDFMPWNVYSFLLIHYIAWMFPLLFVLAYAMLRTGGPRWLAVAAASALAIAIVALCVRYEPGTPREIAAPGGRAVVGPERPLLLEFAHGGADAKKIEISTGARSLARFSDYMAIGGERTVRAMISGKAQGDALALRVAGVSPAQVTAATFSWSAGMDTTRLGVLFPRLQTLYLSAPSLSELDVAGPAGQPDGVRDVELTLSGPEKLLAQADGWQIHLAPGGGAWTSAPQPQPWWTLVARKTADGERRFYLKDNGAALGAKGVVVIGFAGGREVLRARYQQ